jgi:tetratricopeptide (TPR) repeat protein
MLIVQVCDFGVDGDAEYRLHAPSRLLGRSPGTTVVDCHFFHRKLPRLVEEAEVVVLQFVNDWDLLALCSRRRAAGKLTIFEANDYFFDLQPWSPIAAQWHDPTVQELYRRLLRAADGVQTSTAELARRWRLFGATEVAVFPNQIVDFEELPNNADRPLTIGWAGSPGHFADWYRMAPLLSSWLAHRPEVRLAVMTHQLAKGFFSLPPDRYRFASFGSLTDYLNFLRSIDIGLAPLEPTDYNRCRSDVKFLEYASQGVVGIYSDLEPYRTSIVHGETGLLAKSPMEMIDGLEMLSHDRALCERIRRRAYDEVRRNRRLADHVGDRLSWYESLRSKLTVPKIAVPSIAVHEIAVPEVSVSRGAVGSVADARDGYHELRPEEPERTLMSALGDSNKADAARRLDELLAREPSYLVALQHQGRIYNDLHDNRRALEALHRAREAAPGNPRTENEIGRAWFGLDDALRAREAIEETLRIEPRYLPAWQYLLRLLSIRRASDGPTRARQARELFPSCYSIALLAAAIEPDAAAAAMALRCAVTALSTQVVPAQRSTVLAALRQSIAAIIKQSPTEAELVPLLRTAWEVFPESAWLAGEFGAVLYRCGEFDAAFEMQARAFDIRRRAQLYREEFPVADDPAWAWQFADHLHRR